MAQVIPHGTLHGHNYHRCRCEACKDAIRTYKRQWNEKHYRRVHELCTLKLYGLTSDDYDEILARQGGGCAICGGPPNHGTRCRNFDVDHDHATGQVRGLLCNPCNRQVGLVEAGFRQWPHVLAYLTKAVA